MSQTPLMPKATAVWLVENTSLTFEQIAEFCKLHPLEVRGIADGEVAAGIKGLDPITSGQLTREELERAAKNPNHHLRARRAQGEGAGDQAHQGPALHPGLASARTARTPSSGCCATIPSSRTRRSSA